MVGIRSLPAYSPVRTANQTTVIPAKAGIQYLGMDSGSPLHSARTDGQTAWLVSVPCQRIPMRTANQTTVILAKAGIHSTSAWIPGLRFTPPGMTGLGYLFHALPA